MRIRTWWLFPMLLLIAALSGISLFRTDLQLWLSDKSPVVKPAQTSDDTTTSTIVYKVTRDEWITFALPPHPDSVRIISNGCLSPRIQTQQTDREWHYQISYRILNAQQVIDEGTYDFRSYVPEGYVAAEPREAVDDDLEQRIRMLFFQDSDHLPCGGRQMILGLDKGDETPTTLQLKLTQHDEGLDYCVVRCMCDNIVPDDKLERRWNRLSPEKREKLTEGMVYPLHLLSDVEKQNLVRHQWMPLAPSGIEGRNYARRRMFRYSDFVPLKPSENENNPLSEGTRVAFRIPPTPGTLRVTVDAGENSESTPKTPQPLVIKSRSDDPDSFRQHKFLTEGRHETFAIKTDGGLLNVESEMELDVGVEWYSHDDEVPIPLSAAETRFRAYVAQPNMAVRYSIVRNNSTAAPIRLSLRRVISSSDQSVAELRWKTVNENGAAVATGMINLNDSICPRSRLRHDVLPPNLTEPVKVFIPLNQAATTLILEADVPTVISASTRPNQLPAIRTIAEEAQPSRVEDENKTWFLLRPLNAPELALQQQVATVIVQPEFNPPDSEAKEPYLWKSFQPSARWSARHLLVPEPSAAAFRPEAATISYFGISPNTNTEVDFLSTEAELCFWQNSSESNPITIQIDDQWVMSETLLVPSGRIRFPIPPIGDKRVRQVYVSSQKPVSLALNEVMPLGERYWRRRLATRFESQQLEFSYLKSHDGPQTLSLKLFRPTGTSSETQLQVRVAGEPNSSGEGVQTLDELRQSSGLVTALTDWTIPETRFVIQRIEQQDVVSLSHFEESLEQCGTCFVKLGDDLPAGQYRIQVAKLSGDARYLTCTTLEEPSGDFVDSRRVRMPNLIESLNTDSDVAAIYGEEIQ